jgi:hypothetical protein
MNEYQFELGDEVIVVGRKEGCRTGKIDAVMIDDGDVSYSVALDDGRFYGFVKEDKLELN